MHDYIVGAGYMHGSVPAINRTARYRPVLNKPWTGSGWIYAIVSGMYEGDTERRYVTGRYEVFFTEAMNPASSARHTEAYDVPVRDAIARLVEGRVDMDSITVECVFVMVGR